uniref:Uncharacterized protein n=1 Tax=Panagrolaimus sp. ES5 TaxID=591445 RepID=A0AC34F2H0_9BILA
MKHLNIRRRKSDRSAANAASQLPPMSPSSARLRAATDGIPASSNSEQNFSEFNDPSSSTSFNRCDSERIKQRSESPSRSSKPKFLSSFVDLVRGRKTQSTKPRKSSAPASAYPVGSPQIAIRSNPTTPPLPQNINNISSNRSSFDSGTVVSDSTISVPSTIRSETPINSPPQNRRSSYTDVCIPVPSTTIANKHIITTVPPESRSPQDQGPSLWGRSDSEQALKATYHSKKQRALSLNGPETAKKLIEIVELAEFWNFCEFAWPLLLSIIIWLVVSLSPNPPQRRFDENAAKSDKLKDAISEVKSAVKHSPTFKSIDDSFFPQSHAFLPDSRFRFRRKKYEKKKRWSSSISLTSASTDLYFGRSTSLIFDKQQIFSSLCDSGHVSLRESVESLPNYSSLDKEFIEIQQFVNELNKNLENLTPG